jgi:hypothetical protein
MPDIIGLNLAGECDPLDLSATCWPHICLLDVKHDPLWLQIRFVGTEIVRFKSGMGRANGSTT